MRNSPQSWPLRVVRLQESVIDPQPPRQRGPVWSVAQRQLFIDSVLRRYDIPKLYLRQIKRDTFQFEVIDGQQRLRAVWAFYRNEYPLSLDADPVDGEDVAGKSFDELSFETKNEFEQFTLQVVLVEDATDDEVDEMFIRYQNGVPLNTAEKRNAISGAFRDYIHSTAAEHCFFTATTATPNRRFAHDELLAQMTMCELNGGPSMVKAHQLKDMYEKNRRSTAFAAARPKPKKIRKVLDFLASAFPERTPELTKASSLSIYLLASDLLENYAISNRTSEFSSWFIEFERRRRQALATDATEDERDDDLATYDRNLIQQSASRSALDERHRVLKRDIVSYMPNLEPLDPRRGFSEEQRMAIYRRYDETCANPDTNPDCVGKCEWNNFHADHLVPWSAGGKTTVDNGQLLCPSCNMKKGDQQS